MRETFAFLFILVLAGGIAIQVADLEPGSRQVACTSLPQGSWFAAEYCGPPTAPAQEPDLEPTAIAVLH